MRLAALAVAVATALAACAGPSTPVPVPTVTATAISSATPLPAASPTPTPSLTPPTETVAPPPPTVAAGTTGSLDCKVLIQAIKNGRHFSAGQHFDMGWMVENNGTAAWDPGSVDFTFYGGTKMYASTPTHLQQTVAPGDTVLLVADLIAPKNPGKYTTAWALRQGKEFFCPVRLTLYVP